MISCEIFPPASQDAIMEDRIPRRRIVNPAHARRQQEVPANAGEEIDPESRPVDGAAPAAEQVVPIGDSGPAGPDTELERIADTAPGDEAPDENASPAFDIDRLEALLVGKGEASRESAGAQDEPAPSLHGYHEWQLQRLQRRLRVVTWAFVAFAAATLAYLGATSGLFTSTSTGGREETAQVAQDLDGVEEDLRTLKEAQATNQQALGSISRSVDRMQASIASIDRDLQRLARCASRSISTVDGNLRDLVERNITPEAFVRRPAPASCKRGGP